MPGQRDSDKKIVSVWLTSRERETLARLCKRFGTDRSGLIKHMIEVDRVNLERFEKTTKQVD